MLNYQEKRIILLIIKFFQMVGISLAMKKQFKNRKLVACMELHTFSSLNKEFLQELRDWG